MTTKTAAYGLPYPHPSTPDATTRMRANRSVDTTPERLVRSGLHRLGLRFRTDYRVRTATRTIRVDVAFPRERLAVFIDGCFWHCCPEHGTTPRSNQNYWVPKLERNVERDARTTEDLGAGGWTVLRIWEHVRPAQAVALVVGALERARSRPPATRRGRVDRARTAIDLFAGAGGSTEGLKLAGYWVRGAVELDESAARSYRANHEDVRLFENDIRDVSPRFLRESLGLAPGELDLLNACPPCQGFSTLGSGSVDDPRNDLVSLVRAFLEELRPKAFVLENVPGLRSDERLKELLDLARAAGYAVRSYVVNATEFGVPQGRRRLIVIGVRGIPEERLPAAVTDLLPESFVRTPPPVVDVLAKAGPIDGTKDPVHRARQSTPAVLARIQSIPPGGDRFDLPKDQQLECHKSLGRRNATAAYGRIRLDRPAPTLTTRCTTPACGRFVHPTEDRGISLREAALLQTFPPRYRFYGSHQSCEAQIGNAVPVRMAKGLGLAVEALLPEGQRG